MSYRPGGVTALVVTFLIIAILGGGIATLNGISYLPLLYIFQGVFIQVQVIVIFIVAEMYIFAAIGLFYMKRWGRYLALILGILMIIVGIVLIIALIGLIPLTLGIIVVVYLMTDVKHEFEQ